MAYARFLNDKDYLSIITPENFGQLVRDMPARVVQAEQAAEMDMREYLDQLFEIDKELCKGKAIRPYSPMVNYPPDARFYYEGLPVRTLTNVSGHHRPQAEKYWEQTYDIPMRDGKEDAPRYIQMATYRPGQVVKYGVGYWRCMKSHGCDFNDISIPGSNIWTEVPFTEWEPMVDYAQFDVVHYREAFYMFMVKEKGFDTEANPLDNDCWGQIGEYSTDYEYDVDEGKHDYAVFGGKVFKPIQNPNMDRLEEHVNFVYDDPRNANIVKHMTRIALYYLHQTVSPTNIPQSRQYMYEESKDWLYKASKLRVNPQIPRKRDEKGQPKDDWAFADYVLSYEYVAKHNPWLL